MNRPALACDHAKGGTQAELSVDPAKLQILEVRFARCLHSFGSADADWEVWRGDGFAHSGGYGRGRGEGGDGAGRSRAGAN